MSPPDLRHARATGRAATVRTAARRLRRLRRDEGGFVLVFVAVSLPALLALAGLVLDGTRLITLDTELAGTVDAAALAAANQLDWSPSAIPRAREAARVLATAAARIGPEGGRLGLSFRFAANLEDLRRSPTFSLAEASSAAASYVEVTTSEVSLTASFLQVVGVRSASTRRRAIAESQYYACDVTPAVLCHPDPAAFAARARPGQQYLLRMDGNAVAGSIALLDRPDAVNGRQTLRDLASDAPQFCYGNGVALRRNVAPTAFDEALNVRFDRYVGRNGPVDPDLAAYPPAPNVIQGRHLDTCVSNPAGGNIIPPYHLPRDTAYAGLRLSGFWDGGVGDWKVAPANGGTGQPVATALDEYLLWNHANKSPEFQDRLRASPTRYDLYLRELGLTRETEAQPVETRGYGPSAATMPTGGPLTGAMSSAKESPVPVCYAGNAPAVQARRRVVYLSVAACDRFPGAATALNLSRYVGKFFLTEPSDLGATLLEFEGLLRPKEDDGKYRHVVQLVDTR